MNKQHKTNQYKQAILVLLVSSLLLLPGYVKATENDSHEAVNRTKKEFVFDHYWSPYFSAPFLISTRNFLSEAEDVLYNRSTYTVWGRMGSSAFNLIINSSLYIINHEVYGHGFRIRSFEQFEVGGYWFIPFIGGATGSFVLGDTTEDQWLLKSIAGIEANNVLAQEILFKGFKNPSWDSRMYDLFWSALCDTPRYIWRTSLSEKKGNSPGNDIMHYINGINDKHDSDKMTLDMLGRASLVFLANPIFYVSLYSLGSYLITGKDSIAIPHFKLGEVAYMPLVRMGLTPFGIMYYIDNYIGHGDRTFLVSINSGASPFYSSAYGGGKVKTDQLFAYKNYALDVEGNVWCQPKLQLQLDQPLENKNDWGGLVGIHNKVKIFGLFSLHASVLYKTAGFVEGVVAREGFMLRGGFSLDY